MHDLKKFFVILRRINAQKLDSRNRIRGYAYFANSVLFAKKYVLRIFSKLNLKTYCTYFIRAS